MKVLKNEITVILSVWKRNHLANQLKSILKQTKKPHQIWIYQNESHLDIQIPSEFKQEYNVSVIQSKDMNFKFHARFALPLLCDTEYVAIFDDDTIPGPRWLENCIDTSTRNNCIVLARGLSVKREYKDQREQCHSSTGDGKAVEKEVEVDLGGHCWFFKSEWCQYMWRDRPSTWDNGEDIHFSAACKIYGGIRSFVPAMPSQDKSLWGDLHMHLGSDEYATWRQSDHSVLRGDAVKYWIERGWNPLILEKGKE